MSAAQAEAPLLPFTKTYEIPLTMHRTFAAIAIKHFHNSEKLFKLCSDLRRRHKSAPPRSNSQLLTAVGVLEFEREIHHGCIEVVIFCALTLESFINHYGIENLSRPFFEDHLDRLGPLDKWVVIPKMVTGKPFPKNREVYALMRELFQHRNHHVHFKSRRTKDQDVIRRHRLYMKQGARAMRAVRLAVDTLASLDPSATKLFYGR